MSMRSGLSKRAEASELPCIQTEHEFKIAIKLWFQLAMDCFGCQESHIMRGLAIRMGLADVFIVNKLSTSYV